MRNGLVVLTILTALGAACRVATPHEASTEEARTPDPHMEELKYSKFCTDAAEKLWSRHDWKDQQGPQITTYTSHYNKKLNKCLVDIHGISSVDGGKVMESDLIYDALEDTVLCGRLLVKKGGGRDDDIESILLIKDGRTIRDKEEAASFVPWFQSLMKD